jgi:hypothetical protein
MLKLNPVRFEIKLARAKECLECGKMAKCISKKKPRKPRSQRIDTLPTVDEETEVLQEQ